MARIRRLVLFASVAMFAVAVTLALWPSVAGAGGQGGQMFGIDCITGTCVAVGSFDSGFFGDIPETLVERHRA